jgi:hypothetical protein
MTDMGQSETPNHVRSDGSFPPNGRRMRATVAPPGLRLAAELDPIADAGAGEHRSKL